MSVRRILLCALVLAIGAIYSVRGHTITSNLAYAQSEEDHLAREVDDPTAILTQLQFIDLYIPRNFQSSAQSDILNVKPIIPIQPFSLFPFQQLIRPTFALQQLPTSSSSSTMTEFGDIQLFDLFVSNWPDPTKTGFGWAVGPTFIFPTGRVPSAGAHAWEVGPAAAAKYLGIPHLMVGFPFPGPYLICVHEFLS